MKFKTYLILFVILIALIIYLKPDILDILKPAPGGGGTNTTDNRTVVENITGSNIRIASWNLQIFGVSKAGNNDLLESYAAIIDDFDVTIIQEIRDESQTALPALCQKLPGYTCIAGERKGRSTSKEQYGLVYKSSSVTKVTIVTEDTNYTKWNAHPRCLRLTT